MASVAGNDSGGTILRGSGPDGSDFDCSKLGLMRCGLEQRMSLICQNFWVSQNLYHNELMNLILPIFLL